MIKSRIIADSVSPYGKRITTFEVECPRFLQAQINTHKMISKNAGSSRAVPIDRVIGMVEKSPFIPSYWGKNRPGMQATEVIDNPECAEVLWEMAASGASHWARRLEGEGVHKQIVNRILEPFQYQKIVMTATEWENFFFLRNHKDTQPEFQELASVMEKQYREGDPMWLDVGAWHVPYYRDGWWHRGEFPESRDEALMISVSCCAQVSFRRSDDSLEKARKVVEMLNLDSDAGPKHVSPAEHQGTPMMFFETGSVEENMEIDGGITSYHKELGYMSGNFAGWVQHRQMIDGHTRW